MNMRPLGVLTSAVALLSSSLAIAQPAADGIIKVGMTISEMQALMGPPYALKSLRNREVIFYCPHSWIDLVFGDRTFTIVWLNGRRVVAVQAHQSLQRVTCEDFVASFQWSDPVPVDSRSILGSH
jgi:hypothetical protein